MNKDIKNNWNNILNNEFQKEYFIELSSFVDDEYKNKTIYPPKNLIFNAFNLCSFDDVKVVIIGQDPYHGENQAHGLCFTVPDGVKIPPSLRNIFKEINNDLGIQKVSGNLVDWAKQGVFMINATLTVEKDNAGSHQKKGWETFTDEVIKILADKKKNLVFILWGAYAQKKSEFIDGNKHLILKSVHPSPLSASRGFFNNNHFSKANKYLTDNNIAPIDW
jgi:uracil-DNA glycosylase